MKTRKQASICLILAAFFSLWGSALAEEEPLEPLEPEEVVDKVAEKKPPRALPVPSDPVQIYGWEEKVSLLGVDHVFRAKLDTGAKSSSIHAFDILKFQRNGETWVRFSTSETGKPNAKPYQIEAPVVDSVLIKEPNGKPERRLMVRMAFKIGKRTVRANFNLNNRSNMICPILIGRKTISVLGWVDPTRKHLADKELMR